MAPDLHHEYPVVKTTEPAPDVAIRKGRFLFHTLSAAAMINSFFGLTKIATDNAVEQQVSRCPSEDFDSSTRQQLTFPDLPVRR